MFLLNRCIISLLNKSKISNFEPSSMTVQADLCQACFKILKTRFLKSQLNYSTRHLSVPDLALKNDTSRLMGKPTICIDENKEAHQLRGN